MGCCIWYSDEWTGVPCSPSPLLAVPNVTAHPSLYCYMMVRCCAVLMWRLKGNKTSPAAATARWSERINYPIINNQLPISGWHWLFRNAAVRWLEDRTQLLGPGLPASLRADSVQRAVHERASNAASVVVYFFLSVCMFVSGGGNTSINRAPAWVYSRAPSRAERSLRPQAYTSTSRSPQPLQETSSSAAAERQLCLPQRGRAMLRASL